MVSLLSSVVLVYFCVIFVSERFLYIGFNPVQTGVHMVLPYRFLLGCAKTACSRLMELSDIYYNFIWYHAE